MIWISYKLNIEVLYLEYLYFKFEVDPMSMVEVIRLQSHNIVTKN